MVDEPETAPPPDATRSLSPVASTIDAAAPRSTRAEPDLVGRRLLHFHVLARLGAGGMGVVYKALDEKLRRPVALKVLSSRLLADERHRDLLLREARSAAAFNYPGIAAVYEVHDEPEGAFVVMELVEGETLRARLSRTGPLPRAEALAVGRQIAEALARAHASGVVHRDLKCDNVMLTPDGRVKLLDFGIATVQGATELTGTGTGASGPGAQGPSPLAPTLPATPTPSTGREVVGTPLSMAPEQARGDAVDPRADVYGFGVVLYEMLTDRAPFAHRRGAPWDWGAEGADAWNPRPPLNEAARGVPGVVERLVTRCLAFDREGRPADGAALVDAVDACVRAARPRRVWMPIAGVLTVAAAITAGWVGARSRPLAAKGGADALATAPALQAPPRDVRLRRLTFNAPERDVTSAISPDGKHVAYVEGGRVHVRDPATAFDRVLPLSADGTAVSAWFLSPERVLANVQPLAGASRSVVVDLGSGQSEPLTIPGPWNWLENTRDGTLAVLTRLVDDKCVVELLDLRDGSRTQLDVREHGMLPYLSPDGRRLAWVEGRDADVRLVVAEAKAPLVSHDVLASPRLVDESNGNGIAWADAGRLVVAMHDVPGDQSLNLYEVRLDPSGLRSGEPRQLTRWNDVFSYEVRVLTDGSVALARAEKRLRVMVADITPRDHRVSNVRRLTASSALERAVGWGHDGRSVAFASTVTGVWGLYEKRSDATEEPRPVAVSPASYAFPSLMADGKTLLYWKLAAHGEAPARLLRTRVDAPPGAAEDLVLESKNRPSKDPTSGWPYDSAVRCLGAEPRCIVEDWDLSAKRRSWYSVDASHAPRKLEGLPDRILTLLWDVDQRGREIWLEEDTGSSATVRRFAVGEPCRETGTSEVEGTGAVLALALMPDAAGAFMTTWRGVRYLSRDGRASASQAWDGGGTWSSCLGPRVSPDGKQLVFTEGSEPQDLWVAEGALAPADAGP